MSTFAELQQRVADDYINRSDFTNQIKRALQQAVRFYEGERFRFNETATAIAATSSILALPSNYLALDYLEVSLSGGLVPLIPTDLETIRTMNQTSATGVPTHYCVYSNEIKIAIPADSAYSCTLHYLKTLTALSADGDSNDWTNGLFQDLICQHAAKQVWGVVLRNQKEAATFAALEAATLSRIGMQNMQFLHTGLKPTPF